MKAIKKERLIELIKNNIKDKCYISLDVLVPLFNTFGDDGFFVNGRFETTKKNEKEREEKSRGRK